MSRTHALVVNTLARNKQLPWWRWQSRLPAIVLFGVIIYLAIIVATQVIFTSPGYDDSYFGSVSRNFAAGRGYGTIYGEANQILSPEITAGPTVLVPAAVSFKLFGTHYWTGALFSSTASLILLATLCWLLASRLKVPAAMLCLMVITLQTFTNERTPSGDVFHHLYGWSHLMGEIPAGLLVVMAAVLLCLRGSDWRHDLMAGVCLALAFYSKSVVILAAPGFAAFYVWDYWENRRLRPLLAFIAAGLLVVLLVEGGKLLYLGSWDEYVSNLRDVVAYNRNWRPGGGVTDDSTLVRLIDQLNLRVALVPLILWTAVAIAAVARRRSREEIDVNEAARLKLALILFAAAIVHSYWWWAINDGGWTRHLTPAIMYITFALFVLASLVPSRLILYSGIVVFAVLLLSNMASVTKMTPETGSDPRLTALLHASDYLNTIQSQSEDVSLWGCGWWANKELHLVGDLRFYDCADSASVARHLRSGERLLMVRTDPFNLENNPRFAALAEDCDQRTLFREWTFVVCDATPWLSRASNRD